MEELQDREDKYKSIINRHAQEFLGYIKQVEFSGNANFLNMINERVYHEYISSDREKGNKQEYARNILQALSFNLVVIY